MKRPLSAFFLFCQERRVTLKAEEPSLGMGAQTKKMSEEWKAMDAKKKKKYEDLNEKDKKRYEDEVAAKGAPKKKKKVVTSGGGSGGSGAGDDEDKPKRPINAYFMY